jgi:hypothetical protein
MFSRNLLPPRAWTDLDHQVSDMLSSYWVNFATNGDPNGKGLAKWPAFDDRKSDRPMVLGDQAKLGRRRMGRSSRSSNRCTKRARRRALTAIRYHGRGDSHDPIVMSLLSGFAALFASRQRFSPALHQPSGQRVGGDRWRSHHHRLLCAVHARPQDHGQPGAVRRGLVHGRKLGHQDHHRSRPRHQWSEGSQGQLQHLDAAERKAMDADHQQADRPVPPGLRSEPGLRAREDEPEDTAVAGGNLQDRAAILGKTRERCRCCGKTPTRGFPLRCCTDRV